jgi:hypothetical protein
MGDTKTYFDSADEIDSSFLEIDPNPEHWVKVELRGLGTWVVPNTDHGDMTDAMMGEIAGWDDTVEPLKLEDKRGTKFMLAFLLQDGNLAVPGGRYGSDTRTCADIAILMALLMQYHNGEPMSYYSLNSDMGTVVNSGDGVSQLISESQYICDENQWGIKVKDILGDAYTPQTDIEKLVEFINDQVAWVDADEKEDGSVEIFVHDEDGATNLWKLIKDEADSD